jgi:integrase
MALIAGYSAMRIDEIANMRIEHVTTDAFRIVEGKTGNSVRAVPIHPSLVAVVERLKQTSDDGYLITGLLPGGRDNKRSHFPSKYFGRFIRSHGFSDPTLNFHGLRRSWTQRAETAKVPQSTCNLIDGHARQNLSYGLYSDGPDWPVLVEAMAKVSYGNSCDRLAQRRAENCEVTEKMKRRVLRKSRHSAI